MEKELIDFIEKNELKPFLKTKTEVNLPPNALYKTRDAKLIHSKALQVISKNFVFKDTSNLLDFFDTFPNETEIIKKQNFFRQLVPTSNEFLSKLKPPKPFWNPEYGIVVVTEDNDIFQSLAKLGCNVKFIVDETDLSDLERYDIVQVLECETYRLALERLPQSVFLRSPEEACLERHVRTLSGWKENLEILQQTSCPELSSLTCELSSLKYLFDKSETKKLTREQAEEKLEQIKSEVARKVKEQNISGEILLQVINKGILPFELKQIVKQSIAESGLPENIFLQQIPVQLDEKELEKELRNQELNKYANTAREIKRNSKLLTQIPSKLRKLEIQLLLFDFKSTLANWMKDKNFPTVSRTLSLEESTNEFLDNPDPITFYLNEQNRCSMLTGANSGGKTTLLEHIIQYLTYAYLGLPVKGKFSTPIFTELYYFAKNKGSASKGAFETLLTQLSKISPGNSTLILADEIEAVTEPGVAGKIIAASAKYFIEKGSYIVFATHLGNEIQKILPEKSRIDGIEAKGIDEFNELIVDHNPIMGKLASSTPELIVEKMARNSNIEYLKFLNESLKNK